MAGRLAGTKPTLITVRSDSETRSIDSDWRVNIAAGPFAGLYEVKAADTSEKRDFISLLCEAAAD